LAALAGWLQHLALPRMAPALRAAFPWIHVLLWTFLVHQTGGEGSPLALGYLLELPLSGALEGRRGVLMATLASLALYGLYAVTIAAPPDPRITLTVALVILCCAVITWPVVGMLQRHRAQLDASQARLADRAETLSIELRQLADALGEALLSIDGQGRIASVNPSGAALLGLDAERSVGRPWQEVL